MTEYAAKRKGPPSSRRPDYLAMNITLFLDDFPIARLIRTDPPEKPFIL